MKKKSHQTLTNSSKNFPTYYNQCKAGFAKTVIFILHNELIPKKLLVKQQQPAAAPNIHVPLDGKLFFGHTKNKNSNS